MTARRLLALSPLLLGLGPLRDAMESRMALHMLVQFPWLMACGWAALPRDGRTFARIDAHGLLGATAATAVLAFWMLPIAVDLALLSTPVRLAKYASLWAAGLLLAAAWPRWAGETLAFVAGNAAWMTATAGLLYLESDARLCVSYRLDDQVWTGRGLLLWAAALGGFALHRLVASPDSRSASERSGNPNPRTASGS